MISGYDYDYDYIYIYIYIYIAESPPANPRFFLEGAHEPRGRHRVYTAKPDGAPPAPPQPPRKKGLRRGGLGI